MIWILFHNGTHLKRYPKLAEEKAAEWADIFADLKTIIFVGPEVI